MGGTSTSILGRTPGVSASPFLGLNIPAMPLRITFDSGQRDSDFSTRLVGVVPLCLPRLRFAISFASASDIPGPPPTGLCGKERDLLGEPGPGLAGDSSFPSPAGRVG